MQISWHGLTCFEITSKTPQGEATLIVNPYDNTTGLRFPRTLEGQVVLQTHAGEDTQNLAAVSGSPFVISTPGEYEVKGVFVFGFLAPLAVKGAKPHVIYRIESEDMHLAHLGVLDRPLTDEEMELLQNVDILMVPVGGGRVLAPKVAAEVIGELEPRVVIPMMYAIPNVKEKLEAVEAFYKAFGGSRKETATKYKISRKDLPEEDMLLLTLER